MSGFSADPPNQKQVSKIGAGNLPEFSVSEISRTVKRTLESHFERVRVRGEISDVLAA